ncbi:tRNA dihydrouridine synthase [Rhodopirellula sp. MGV]|uniref:tRNA dihydrouridine synthase n=1 Tax=Rhodopirellula sp. MGV TaxID=2023130 RepID=UPI000B96DCF0|nr:tRNA-dihydrouridine synthase [Rhodopirellula sp. MGV]OYP28882.1 tRNA-dihydrouridine synthase [Rhodopirellula sp. MGV]PNY37001.1 tRNA-dihydrouridine synthase [Rhodopirellula baltica]
MQNSVVPREGSQNNATVARLRESTTWQQEFRPLVIGNVNIGFPVVQAALSGYSDLPMRTIARRLGASYSVCEVMLDQFLLALNKRQKTKHFLDIHPEEHPVGGQLMGAEPEQFSQGAMKLVDAGFDIIDVNFGCPVKKVLGRCRGGFHLSQPEVAIDILQRTRDMVPDTIPVTVKMRRGIDDTNESRDAFFQILDGALNAGLAAATVHGRTVVQRYVGPSRWEFLADVKSHVGDRMKILGSGDLFSADDCLRMMRQTGIDGVTVARGAIGNPWIFSQAIALANGEPLPDPPSLHQQAAVLIDHFELCEESYGETRAPLLMRKFGIKYSQSHPDHENVRLGFARIKSRDDFDTVLEKYYGDNGPGRHVPRECHGSQEE